MKLHFLYPIFWLLVVGCGYGHRTHHNHHRRQHSHNSIAGDILGNGTAAGDTFAAEVSSPSWDSSGLFIQRLVDDGLGQKAGTLASASSGDYTCAPGKPCGNGACW
jgi:hypothetical protein